MTDAPKIIGLDGKPFVPPATPEGEATAVKVCENSLRLAKDILVKVEAGELQGLGVIGIAADRPLCAFTHMEDETVPALALLNLAAETLKDMVLGHIDQYIHGVTAEEGDNDDPEDLGA